MLLVNADDFGMKEEITDRILRCYRQRSIHSASAMTFMADSDRAADLAGDAKLPLGLHLNLDENLTGKTVSGTLRDHHQRTAAYLNAGKWNQILYNPFLRNAFDYVFKAQWEEYYLLYGEEPKRRG